MEFHPLLVTGNCFWTLEAIFRALKGVENPQSGYIWMAAGVPVQESTERFPVQKMEAVRFDWDEEQLPPDLLLEVLLTSTSAQLAGWEALDEFSGMRSLVAGIPPHALEAFKQALVHVQERFDEPLHTQFATFMPSWTPAPERDQGFFQSHPNDGFCVSLILPKLERLRQRFPHLVRA